MTEIDNPPVASDSLSFTEADQLAYHLRYANEADQALKAEAETNAYSIRLVHARQYHATMAAAYGALAQLRVLQEFPEAIKRITEEWGIDELRELISRGTSEVTPDGRTNPTDDKRSKPPTNSRAD